MDFPFFFIHLLFFSKGKLGGDKLEKWNAVFLFFLLHLQALHSFPLLKLTCFCSGEKLYCYYSLLMQSEKCENQWVQLTLLTQSNLTAENKPQDNVKFRKIYKDTQWVAEVTQGWDFLLGTAWRHTVIFSDSSNSDCGCLFLPSIALVKTWRQ